LWAAPRISGFLPQKAEDEPTDVIAVLRSRALLREVKNGRSKRSACWPNRRAEAAPGAAGKSRSHSHHKYNHKAIALVHYNTCEEEAEAEAAPAAPGASQPGGGVAAGRHSHSEINCRALDMLVTQPAVMRRKRRRRRQGQRGRAAARLSGRRRRSLWVSPSFWTGASIFCKDPQHYKAPTLGQQVQLPKKAPTQPTGVVSVVLDRCASSSCTCNAQKISRSKPRGQQAAAREAPMQPMGVSEFLDRCASNLNPTRHRKSSDPPAMQCRRQGA